MITPPATAVPDAQQEFQETLSGFTADDRPLYEDYSRCVHCGLCLDQCPTYRLWGKEADSPRGRVRQMLLVDKGRLELGDAFVTHMDRCLDCRACETACPSGVEYGKLIELARAQIEQKYPRPRFSRMARNFVYRWLLPHPGRIRLVARIVRLAQTSGLSGLVRMSQISRLFGMQERLELLPRIDREFFDSRVGQTFPAIGTRRARVAFFAGCIARVTFTALNDATIRVLQANGCEVVVPAGQVCCGALATHAGMRDVARELAQENFQAFADESVDAIVTNAAGCGSTLKEYSHLFDSGSGAGSKAATFSGRVRDITEFLDQLGLVVPMREVSLRVTIQDSCHLVHGQKIREAPRRLLRAIPGIEIVEMARADQCCGSAGVYNVTQTTASMDLLAEKMAYAKATGAAAIVTANPGCMLQLRAGAAMHKTGQEVLHIVELIDRAIAKV
ncbi:MAG: (Fe-S)-binding protein [Candidatus Acidiferrales bacterium]